MFCKHAVNYRALQLVYSPANYIEFIME